MARKSRNSNPNVVVIKRYGNRRLYNTETSGYVTLPDLIELIRAGRDIQVLDSATQEDVTKLILTQIILEEEKNKKNLLPEAFLYQLIRAQQDSAQDFFQNYLAASFEAYLKTRQEFDRRFRSFLELGAHAPQMWERLIPGAEAMKEFWGLGQPGKPPGQKDEEER